MGCGRWWSIPTAIYGLADWNTTADAGVPIADLVTAAALTPPPRWT
jgi:hypothetical protein